MLELDARTLTFDTFCAQCLRANRPAIVRHATHALAATRLRACVEPMALARVLGLSHVVPVYTTVADTTATHARSSDDDDDTAAAVDNNNNNNNNDNDSNDDSNEDVSVCHMRALGDVFAAWAAHTPRALSSSPLLYLKDWHMQLDLESAMRNDNDDNDNNNDDACASTALYRVPHFLGPDWMQPFCAHTRQHAHVRGFGDGRHDYRFVYMGVPHTWTAMHYDVFGTYSWSYNVCGRKRWYFATAHGNAHLHATLPPSFPTPPDMRVLTGLDALLTCEQDEGDLVFVPSGCYHQVHNIAGVRLRVPYVVSRTQPLQQQQQQQDEPHESDTNNNDDVVATREVELTVAVNHNWCNQFCIERMVQLLLEEAAALRRGVSADDLAAVFAPDVDGSNSDAHDGDMDVARCYDAMLQQSCNWSCTSMQHFLQYVMQQQLQQQAATTRCGDNDGGGGDAYATPADGWPSVHAQLAHLLDRVAHAY